MEIYKIKRVRILLYVTLVSQELFILSLVWALFVLRSLSLFVTLVSRTLFDCLLCLSRALFVVC